MHRLEAEYGLSANELLDAVDSRFRARVAVEGAVAEVHLEKIILKLKESGTIFHYVRHDKDGYPDFTVITTKNGKGHRIECKNVRNHEEAFRKGGEIYAYKVETQKTRASRGDPASRYYDIKLFEILAVCLGKKTHKWNEFLFIMSRELARHDKYPGKLAVMHPVPLPQSASLGNWVQDLGLLIKALP